MFNDTTQFRHLKVRNRDYPNLSDVLPAVFSSLSFSDSPSFSSMHSEFVILSLQEVIHLSRSLSCSHKVVHQRPNSKANGWRFSSIPKNLNPLNSERGPATIVRITMLGYTVQKSLIFCTRFPLNCKQWLPPYSAASDPLLSRNS